MTGPAPGTQGWGRRKDMTRALMGADDRHNPGSPVESLYSFNRHLLSAGCVLDPTSGYGSKLTETSKTPTSLVLLLQ